MKPPTRPRNGITPPRGWTVIVGGDEPCARCEQVAATRDPTGTPLHPICWELEHGQAVDGWDNGDSFEVDGTTYEVRRGRKGEGDLVLLWRCQRQKAIRMVHGAILADFFGRNEDRLTAARPSYERAGDKFLDLCLEARMNGWRQAANWHGLKPTR